MAKPRSTPASAGKHDSDIDGVHRDRKPLNSPENADPAHGRKLKQEEEESRAKPPPRQK